MLKRLSDAQIDREIWYTPLFEGDRRPLAQLVGVMLKVPQLRESLYEITDEHCQRPLSSALIHFW
ncbi:hypothetical protein GCM10017771_45550 [Streptomyces capitiformicae]|uniref:Uncharacterized protein n=2 Tax=Streptomyces capitiformicae TaxID=2014920 RepID=A0A918YYC0_9ACTN|nr:hypothetical protein [Streptomyces capitiformicae]GHE29620.1 hypothetical protein GCM10017771_45550 [Streptomyces capitiformicae]